jgi:hypothetical protein
MDPQLDAVTAQLHDWMEAALALDEGHFPREMLNELEDIVGELKTLLDDNVSDYDRRAVTDQFVNPEMAGSWSGFPGCVVFWSGPSAVISWSSCRKRARGSVPSRKTTTERARHSRPGVRSRA